MTTSGYDSPTDVPGTEDLKELALDMRWSWDHGADELSDSPGRVRQQHGDETLGVALHPPVNGWFDIAW